MYPGIISTQETVATVLSFVVGFICSAFDLYQTLYARDVRMINLLRSGVIWAFLFLGAFAATIIFLLTCIYPGDWIDRVIGQQIENVFGRAVVVGLLVTMILRSKVANLSGENSLGIDTFYATLRRQALVALNTKSERVFDKAAIEFTRRLCLLPNREHVLRQLVQHSHEHLHIIFDHDHNRRSRLDALYTRVVQGQMEFGMNGDLADQEERIRDVILWSFRYAGFKEIHHWLSEKLPR